MIPTIVANQVKQSLADFLCTTYPATTPGFVGLMEKFVDTPGALLKGPYLSLSLPFRQGRLKGEYFPHIPLGYIPHAHQEKAFQRLSGVEPRSTLIATGTGSGKTECFLLPILEHCRLAKAQGIRGIKAILLYPMNALATDQAARIARLIVTSPGLQQVTAGLFVGDEPDVMSRTVQRVPVEGDDDIFTVITNKDAVRENPPDILLTNYKMLDFLLIRRRDRTLWRDNGPETLRYLVVDELHTFDGAQGTDLACLIRRLKARLHTPERHLVCVGTSATLGDDDRSILTGYAEAVFAEPFDDSSMITEDRFTLGEYLTDSVIEFVQVPTSADLTDLRADSFSDPPSFLARQFHLWFGETVSPEAVADSSWRVELGDRLKRHLAFQNLLRDIHRLGKAATLDALAENASKWVRDAVVAPPDFLATLLSSLLALVSHARRRLVLLEGNTTVIEFLQVRSQLWVRELRRMVANVSLQEIALRHADDLSTLDEGVFLPVIHCRDCHVMGWGAVRKAGESRLLRDLQTFYAHFFNYRIGTTFLFPAHSTQPESEKVLQRLKLCGGCGTLNDLRRSDCLTCGGSALVTVEIPYNRRQKRRNNGAFWVIHHDCPYCGGKNSLTILGSQSASLSSVMIGQTFASTFAYEKKLIAFSDSVQDAAHRAGFFTARAWQLNFRPALLQAIVNAEERLGTAPTLADIPELFEAHWLPRLGAPAYLATFLPPELAWLKDYEALIKEGRLPAGSDLPDKVRRCLQWRIFGEFAQRAHVGRTLERTQAATLAPDASLFGQVAADLAHRLREEIGEFRTVGEATVAAFLRGLLLFMRHRGAVHHETLEPYARNGCNRFACRRGIINSFLFSGFYLPIYLTLELFGECDAVIDPDAPTWYEGWCWKCFRAEVASPFPPALTLQIYRLTLDALSAGGLVTAVESTAGQLYALRPEALMLTRATARYGCAECRDTLIVAASEVWTGMPCRRVACQGVYAPAPDVGGFYRQHFATADVARVFAREHTGLLPRKRREALEREFKDKRGRPGKTNLLSATPTLEMGIDIGDLSAVLLCSVPPAQANYLQRVGRAGRATGNSLTMTVATGQPHDLFFYADPPEMLAGSVTAPGIYLNASAVLERQLTAFCLDSWVERAGDGAVIPARIREVLSAVRNRNLRKFPYTWFAYIDGEQTVLLENFAALFTGAPGHSLTPDSLAWLAGFMYGGKDTEGSFCYKILNRLEEINQEVESLKRRREQVDRELARLRGLPARGESEESLIGELEEERHALTHLSAELEGQDTLNLFTDEGLLPNYAFPEQGVTLRSIIFRNRAEGYDGKHSVITLEYDRPAASAISELAPGNTFYAEGRKVVVDQVDVSRSEPESWRFCRQCAHAEQEVTGQALEACPRCGDPQWSDAGRLRNMLRLKQVYAHARDSESRISDDADDRERCFFTRQALVEHDPASVRKAYRLDRPEFPFSFEFLDRITFREINFGEKGEDATAMMIAGEELPRPGFRVCRKCGTIQRRRRPGEESRNHALFCPWRQAPERTDIDECLFLYREFSSEAIRMLLPIASIGGSTQRIHSFIAALHLGLIKRFSGAVDHLRVARQQLVTPDSGEVLNFLVIYDSIPGGTGYLKQLMRDARPLFEVLHASLQVLDECVCSTVTDPVKDGCYRCLYAYRNNFDRPDISRDMAKWLIRQIVDHEDKLVEVARIEPVGISALHDSELERRFIEALQRPLPDRPPCQIQVDMIRGKTGYLLTVGGCHWQIELQVPLDESDGVMIPSRADFVFRPVGRNDVNLMPIVVFTDGWRYHQDQIGYDLAQRMAVAKSGRYLVWSLTWDDIEPILSPSGERVDDGSCLADLLAAGGAIPGGELYQRLGIAQHLNFPIQSTFLQFRSLLEGLPPVEFTTLSRALLLRMVARNQKTAQDLLAEILAAPPADLLGGVMPCALFRGAELAGAWRSPDLGRLAVGVATDRQSLTRDGAAPAVVIALNDRGGGDDPDRKRRWRHALHLSNLFLALPQTWCCATGGEFDLAPLNGAPVFMTRAVHDGYDWRGLYEFVIPELHGLLDTLRDRGGDPPDTGYELLNDMKIIIAEAELAWQERLIAVVTDEKFLQPFRNAGWEAFYWRAGAEEETQQGILESFAHDGRSSS